MLDAGPTSATLAQRRAWTGSRIAPLGLSLSRLGCAGQLNFSQLSRALNSHFSAFSHSLTCPDMDYKLADTRAAVPAIDYTRKGLLNKVQGWYIFSTSWGDNGFRCPRVEERTDRVQIGPRNAAWWCNTLDDRHAVRILSPTPIE